MKQYAELYINKGWKVLPLHSVSDTGKCTCGDEKCTSAGKHPIHDKQLCPSGVHSASDNINVIYKWLSKYPFMNIGIATGQDSNLTVLDVDGRKGGIGTVEHLYGDDGEDLLDTSELVVRTGDGFHLFYSYDPIAKNGSNRMVGVDIRSTGGYIVAPPSRHASGKQYEFIDEEYLDETTQGALPQSILKLLSQSSNSTKVASSATASQPSPAKPAIPLSDTEKEDIAGAIKHIPADERDTWIRVGMALHSTGAGHEAFEIWDTWSQTTKSGNYRYKDALINWRSFKDGDVTIASLFGLAQEHGYMYAPQAGTRIQLQQSSEEPSSEYTAEELDLQDLTGVGHKRKAIPAKLLQLNGTMQDIMNHILQASVRPQPVLALASTLSCFGTIIGRRYSTGYGGEETRSNVFVVGLAPSGAGKDITMKMTTKILEAGNLFDRVGASKIGSGSGLLHDLGTNHCQQYQLDEFGLALQSMTSSGSSQHTKEVISTLMELYSCAAGTYQGGAYATKQRVRIEQPHCCVYGVSTPEEYYKAFNSGFGNNGFFGRWLAFEVMEDVPKRRVPKGAGDIDPQLAKRIETYAMYENMPVNGNMTHYVHDVPMTPDAELLFDGFADYAEQQSKRHELRGDSVGTRIWARAVENSRKLALLWACSERAKDPEITITAIEWATALITHLVEDQIIAMENHVSDTENESLHQMLMNVISIGGARGIPAAQFKRKYVRKLGARRFNEIMRELIDLNVIEMFKVKGEVKTLLDKPVTRYRLSVYTPSGEDK